MADLKLNNEVKNITYTFYLKGNDFKELSLKSLTIKKWIVETTYILYFCGIYIFTK